MIAIAPNNFPKNPNPRVGGGTALGAAVKTLVDRYTITKSCGTVTVTEKITGTVLVDAV